MPEPGPADERWRIEARLYAAAHDIEPVQVDTSDGGYQELSGEFWAYEHAGWRTLSELLGIDLESDDGDIAEAITALRADRDRLSAALREMARRHVTTRRRAASAAGRAQSRFIAYKGLLNQLGSAVGVHVGSPSENRYQEFAKRIIAAALRHRADLAASESDRTWLRGLHTAEVGKSVSLEAENAELRAEVERLRAACQCTAYEQIQCLNCSRYFTAIPDAPEVECPGCGSYIRSRMAASRSRSEAAPIPVSDQS